MGESEGGPSTGRRTEGTQGRPPERELQEKKRSRAGRLGGQKKGAQLRCFPQFGHVWGGVPPCGCFWERWGVSRSEAEALHETLS